MIVDSSSIEVNRRLRRAKADNLDAVSLVGLLIRYCEGETKVWSTVGVPDPLDEDQRHLHRELDQLRRERTSHSNRVRGLLATIGVKFKGNDFSAAVLDLLRQWNDEPLPAGLKQRLLREFERMELLARQIKAMEVEQAPQICDDKTRNVEKVRTLMGLKGVGQTTASILVYEFFGWRQFANRRELAGLAGLTPTPYQSGDSNLEQGISKAGNAMIRWIMVEVSWSWLRFQPESALAKWYQRRFASGTSRMKRIGTVALARKLLIALWRYVEHGEVPEEAKESDWEAKLKRVLAVLTRVARGRDQSPQVPPPHPLLLPSSLCCRGNVNVIWSPSFSQVVRANHGRSGLQERPGKCPGLPPRGAVKKMGPLLQFWLRRVARRIKHRVSTRTLGVLTDRRCMRPEVAHPKRSHQPGPIDDTRTAGRC